MNNFICGGPFSLCTSNVTVIFLFNAISCTRDIGDFKSELASSVTEISAESVAFKLLSRGFKTSNALLKICIYITVNETKFSTLAGIPCSSIMSSQL